MPKEYNCVKKTKRAFEKSLVELCKEYPFNKISVTMLCDKAELSRNAFYFHYKDINDLLSSIEDRLYDSLTNFLPEISKTPFPDNILLTVKKIVGAYYANADALEMINSIVGDDFLIDRVSKAYSDFNYKYFEIYNSESKKAKFEYLYMFISGGFYTLLKSWTADPSVMTQEQVVDMAYLLIKRLLVRGNPNIEDIIDIN